MRSFIARVPAVLALLACAALSVPLPSRAEDVGIEKGRFAAGLNYPGLGLRYFLTDRYSLELKGQFATNIVVGGLRTYRYFAPRHGMHLFAGLEADYVNFKGDRSKGSGAAGQLFLGGECFFMRRLSAQLDFGPAYVYLPNKQDPSSVSGIEYVVNFGINYYFGRGSEEPATVPAWESEATPEPPPKAKSKRKDTQERNPFRPKPYVY